ncbi:unnamed protein product [Durusdinium trenchii]|uniref:Uncharacterized protein n=2 Tax=Durusdinium trenchii TaxID=1381693 RepID=A0ABP0I4E5_9DINO
MEEEGLLAEAEVFCQRLNRSRTHWGLERDSLAARVASTEDRVRSLQQRNEQLTLTVKLLEEALVSCRSRSAECLGELFKGLGPVEITGAPTDRLGAVGADAEWRALALRIPRRRKSWAEAKAAVALSKAGLPEEQIEETASCRPSKDLEDEVEGSQIEQGTTRSGVGGKHPWEVVATLHSPLDDGVRSARIFQGVLLTAAEDSSVKAWDLGSIPQTRETPCEDLEPFAKYRAHSGPVLSLALPDPESCLPLPVAFSGGMDGDIYSFELQIDASADASSALRPVQRYRGHQEAVLSLDLQSRIGLLASAGADQLVLLWRVNPTLDDGRLASPFEVLDIPPPHGSEESSFGPLTDLAWGPRSGATLLCCSRWASTCCAMDAEQGVAIYGSSVTTREDRTAPVLAVASHALRDIAVSGHAGGGGARVFSALTGRPMWTLESGDKVISSVALDPFGNGFEVVTASSDGSLQIFDLRTCRCVQEAQLHASSGINSVCLAGDFIATAGADAVVNLLEKRQEVS